MLQRIRNRIALFITWRLPQILPFFLIEKQKKEIKVTSKCLLIIRTDAIGDYVLFRNFLEILATSEKYKNYKITLLGNQIWKNLAENLDTNWVDNFIWLDRERFLNDPIYHTKLILKIRKKSYESVIYPTFSREFFHGDYLVKMTRANQKIAHQGDFLHESEKIRLETQKIYDQLILTPSKTIFEFYRNQLFFENLLHQKMTLQNPFFPKNVVSPKSQNEGKKIIFFPSANADFRRWSPAYFAKLSDLIAEKFAEKMTWKIEILGSSQDAEIGQKIQKLSKQNIVNECGKTSLIGLIQKIAEADLLISNETVAIHLAACVKTPTICISNGNHLGRFNPYPPEIAPQILTIYPKNVQVELKNESNREKIYEKYAQKSDENIQEITPKEVFSLLEKMDI